MYLVHHWKILVLIDEETHQLIHSDPLMVVYKNVLQDYEQSGYCSVNFQLVWFSNIYILKENLHRSFFFKVEYLPQACVGIRTLGND